MLIAVAGAQGSGKGTILAGLADQGYTVIPRKTSRSILEEWDVTLDQVNNDHELTARFQSEITQRKFDDELDAMQSDELILTERTHADLFTYALITLGLNNQFSNWVDQYYLTCRDYTRQYHHIVWVPSGMFPVKSDGVRGANKHYSHMADIVMLDATKGMVDDDKISYITTSGVDDRVEETIKIIKDNT